MISFDLWDTLIARRSISDIYNEENNCFPIAENVAKVKADSVIISDYYDAGLAQRLVKEVLGLDNQVVVSSQGKANGYMFEQFKHLNHTDHYGDNEHSDVRMANQHGIRGHYTAPSPFTALEGLVDGKGLRGLSRVMRETRLTTFNQKYRNLELLQTQLNFPMLFVGSLLLHRTQPERLLMCARDCCLWQHLQAKVRDLCGGKYEIVYFRTSRLACAFPKTGYWDYVKSLMPGTIVDLAASGKTLLKIREATGIQMPLAILMQYDNGVPASDIIRLTDITLRVEFVEFMNLDRSPLYLSHEENENPINVDWNRPEIAIQHETFMKCLEAMKHYDLTADLNISDSVLLDTFRMLYENVTRYTIQIGNPYDWAYGWFEQEHQDTMRRLNAHNKE